MGREHMVFQTVSRSGRYYAVFRDRSSDHAVLITKFSSGARNHVTTKQPSITRASLIILE